MENNSRLDSKVLFYIDHFHLSTSFIFLRLLLLTNTNPLERLI